MYFVNRYWEVNQTCFHEINCSKIIVGDALYEIDCFLQVTVMVTDSSSNNVATEKHWFVQSLSYACHQCKPWFGYPAQVWSTSLNAEYHYFLLKKISSRVV